MTTRARLPIIFLVLTALAAGAFLYVYGAPTNAAAQIRDCGKNEPTKQQCYQLLIEDATRSDGVAAGFDMLALLYELDPKFPSYCHANTHELGKVAYEQFKAHEDFTMSPKTQYCGFGFYHGFLEAMLHDRGDLVLARDFCEYVDAQLRGEINGTSYACYHGIGHGVVDGTDTRLWGDIDAYIKPGLALCEQLPTDVEEHKTRCASGVFNALAIAYLYPKYGLKPNPDDPYDVCRRQSVPYARKACYDQMNGYVNKSSPDFLSSLRKAIATAEPEYRALAVETTAGFRVLESLRSGESPDSYIADCASLESMDAKYCVRGFSSALIEHGKPGAEYEEALDACMESGAYLDMCLEGIIVSAYDRLPVELRAALCRDIETRLDNTRAERCRAVMENDVRP